MELSPSELVAEIERGNPQAEAVFLTQMRKPVFSMLYVRTRSIADADDLAQETLVTALSKIREGKVLEPEKIRSFVRGIARRKFAEWIRKHRPEGEDPEQLPSAETEVFGDDSLVPLIRVVIEQLIERDREILSRHYLLQEPKPATCEFLDITPDH